MSRFLSRFRFLSTMAAEEEKGKKGVFKRVVSLATTGGTGNLKPASRAAADELEKGNVIAVPTDTVYGVACLVQHKRAVEKLYALKGRHPDKPLAVCLPEVEDVFRWAEVTVSRELLERLLPGPVTLCFRRADAMNRDFNPGATLVGIRIPDHAFIRAVCREVGGTPLALTSANVSSSGSCLDVSEFFDELAPRGLGLVFDGGRISSSSSDDTECQRLGSTIVDLSAEGFYSIMRPGSAPERTVRILESHGLKRCQ